MKFRVLWDPRKAAINLAKHGVSFDEGREAMTDPLARSASDRLHSTREDRFALIGETLRRRLILVVYTIRSDEAWLIHAHAATPAERRRYMSGEDIIRDAPIDDDDRYLLDYGQLEGWRRGRHKFELTAASVTLEPDVFDVFKTSEEVNAALRELIAAGRAPEAVTPPPSPPARPAPRAGARRR